MREVRPRAAAETTSASAIQSSVMHLPKSRAGAISAPSRLASKVVAPKPFFSDPEIFGEIEAAELMSVAAAGCIRERETILNKSRMRGSTLITYKPISNNSSRPGSKALPTVAKAFSALGTHVMASFIVFQILWKTGRGVTIDASRMLLEIEC